MPISETNVLEVLSTQTPQVFDHQDELQASNPLSLTELTLTDLPLEGDRNTSGPNW